MIISNYEDDIVFARFLKYINKAFYHKAVDYVRKQNKKEGFEVIVNDYKWQNICETTINYELYDQSEFLKYSGNPVYVVKLDLALSKLSKKQKIVIESYYYKEMTNKEIAEKLTITENAVEKLKIRALKKIRTSFTEEIKYEMED